MAAIIAVKNDLPVPYAPESINALLFEATMVSHVFNKKSALVFVAKKPFNF